MDLENEYKQLIDEIMLRTKNWTDFILFSITLTTTIFGIAQSLDSPIPYIYLLPNILLIIMNYRILNCKRFINKISSYMIVFLEPEMPSRDWLSNIHKFSDGVKSKGKFSKIKNLGELFFGN